MNQKHDIAVFELYCEVQKYAWGKLGLQSEVARLSQLARPDFIVDSAEPYAELWMGAHPKAPSNILKPNGDSSSLLDFVKAHPDVLGEKVKQKFNGELPFLFKVLSVNKSLSIQAHPNKSHAEKLFRERPDIYKDPNHKPEMAIALTRFEGMCGFRPIAEIKNFLVQIPEFRAVVGENAAKNLIKCSDNENDIQANLKACFENVMKCDKNVREENIKKLVARVTEMEEKSKSFEANMGELLIRLNSQFPGDVGCFVIYFLNHITLQPGDAMFLGANEPHAYLDGNCIECMACSDNVVRAGLTPKLIDVPTLCEMLNYTPGHPESKKFPAVQSIDDPFLRIYNPPVDDFAVQCISVPSNQTGYTVMPVDSASILLVLEGTGVAEDQKLESIKIRPGAVFFISANTEMKLVLSGEGLMAFRALCIL